VADEKTLEERLRAARERSASAQKKHETALAVQEVEAEEKAAELREKLGFSAVALLNTLGGFVVITRPHDMAWKEWEKACVNAGKHLVPDKAIDNLVGPCFEYPVDYQKFKEATPGSLGEVVHGLAKLVGTKAAEDLGK
jgi:hypothetical protein